MQNLLNRIFKSPKLLLLFIALATSTSWFLFGSGIIYFHDEIIPVNPSVALSANKFLWFDNLNYGLSSSGAITKLPVYFIFYAFGLIGVSVEYVQVILYLFLLSSASISSYVMFKLFIGKERALDAALIYTFNPFVILYIWRLNYIITRAWFYAFLPLLLYFQTKALKCAPRDYVKYLFFIFIASLIASPANSQPVFFIITLISSLFAFSLVVTKDKFQDYFKRYFISGIVFLSANLYWAVPRIWTFKSEIEAASSVGLESAYIANSEKLSLLKSFLLSETVPLYEINTWYSWTGYYSSIPFALIGVALLIFALFAVRKFPTRINLLSTSIYLLGIVFFIGSADILTQEKLFIFNNIELMKSFRDPGKWGFLLLIPFSIIFANAVHFAKFKLNRGAYSKAVLPVLIVFMAWPMLSANAIPKDHIFEAARTNIPSSYYEAAMIMEPDTRPFLQLPVTGTHNYAKWEDGGYKGFDLLRVASGKAPLNYAGSSRLDVTLTQLQSSISERSISSEELYAVLDQMNISDIVVNLDSDSRFIKAPTSSMQMFDNLNDFYGLDLKYSSQEIAVFGTGLADKTLSYVGSRASTDLIEEEIGSIDITDRNWLLASQSGAEISDDALSQGGISVLSSAEYFYIRNEIALSLDFDNGGYLNVITDSSLPESSYEVRGSIEGDSGDSSWLRRIYSYELSDSTRLTVFKNESLVTDLEYLRLSYVSDNESEGIYELDKATISKRPFNDLETYRNSTEDGFVLLPDQSSDIPISSSLNFSFVSLNRLNYEGVTNVVDGESVIMLKKTYDDGWALSTSSALHKVSKLNVNGQFNGWIISGPDIENIEFKVEYRTQQIVGLSLIAQGLVFAIVTTNYVIILIKDRNE